jgi:hypothetical protein
MKYTIINTVLILKPPLFMCKAKVYFFPHIIDTVVIFQMCTYDYYMVPKIIKFPYKELYFPSK